MVSKYIQKEKLTKLLHKMAKKKEKSITQELRTFSELLTGASVCVIHQELVKPYRHTQSRGDLISAEWLNCNP